MKVISFYKYTRIKNPELLKERIREKCNSIKGRILIGKEGINGACSGNIEKFKEFLVGEFPGLTFREQECEKQVYSKLVVRTRKEIVNFGEKVDLRNAGKHISPEELQKTLDNKEEVILLDARNDYEVNVGKFKNAISLNINNFREFPEKYKKLNSFKNKKIIMYCTGGVRCEKSSAYLKEKGFTNVNQLEGGIINYVNNFPNTHFKGGCFVFDNRLNFGEIKCSLCNKQTSSIINCHNLNCDKLIVSCKKCQERLDKSCSLNCKQSTRRRKKKYKKIGKVINYYGKKKIALAYGKLKKGQKILIKGRTTNTEETIQELSNDKGLEVTNSKNEIVTFPVGHRVRTNDEVLIER